jgi:23S rRNA (pseudouridine1915-N3)-methyltransferase
MLAKTVADFKLMAKDVFILIGGPDGLSPECLARANQKWSLSALTFPHALARVLMLEQLYRACSMLENHPYHRE